MPGQRPSESVLRAFGVSSDIRPMRGGQDTSWLAGNLVLKPGVGPEHQWIGEVLSKVDIEGIRVATPIATCDGGWTLDGWVANRFESGSDANLSRPPTWAAVIEAGRAFHKSVAHLGRPDFIDSRDDPWAVADRVAWGERSMRLLPELAEVATRLQMATGPSDRSQVVHGDLTGNVLFAPGLPPVVIDLSLYWRPPSYAEGVVIADALCWHGADASLLDRLGVPVEAVARALLFRIATTNALAAWGGAAANLKDEAHRYERAAVALGI